MRRELVAKRMRLQEARHEAERCMGAVLSLETATIFTMKLLRLARASKAALARRMASLSQT